MSDGLVLLLSLSLVMGLASFVAGSLPLLFTPSPRKMRLITACGTGVLVGTALIVVIPEGVETLYSSARPISVVRARTTEAKDITNSVSVESRDYDYDDSLPKIGDLPDLASPQSNDKPASVAPDLGPPRTIPVSKSGSGGSRGRTQTQHADYEPHAWIGISVISGFILMYLIDQLPRAASAANTRRPPAYISLERLGLDSTQQTGTRQAEAIDTTNRQANRPMPLTTGLVIHAAADGIALGASTTSSSQSLSLVIFLALMIHKAPAAFGLTAVLLRRHTSRRRIRAHLLIFSLAAPVGALAAWAAVQSVGGNILNKSEHTAGFATGVLLLFSGGTFLYVAMHAMQDANHEIEEQEVGSTEYANPYAAASGPEQQKPSMLDVLTLMGGMLLPLLTQFGHHF